MILLSKKLIIDNTTDILKLKEWKEEKVKVILSNEGMLIHIVKIKKNESIHKKIENVVKDLFLGNNQLVHYEKLWVKGRSFLLIYVIGCSDEFKNFLFSKKKFSIIPIDFLYKGMFSFKKTRVVVKNEKNIFKIRIYFKRKLVLVKTTTEENYLYDIKKELLNIEEKFSFKVKTFDLIVENKYIKEELKSEFLNAKVIESRGESNIYSKI